MARSKTGTFVLTENVQIAAAAVTGTGTVATSAYIDVGSNQGLAVEKVDIIWQDEDATGLISTGISGAVAGNTAFDCQLTDLNPNSVILRADSNALIASGSLNLDDANNILTMAPDVIPDEFGKLDQARMVISDQMFVVATSSQPVLAGHIIHATVRISCRIVALSKQDWVSIALTQVASD